MIKEEDILVSRFGKENHFKVPEGYFEQLADKVMERLPEQEARIVPIQPTMWQRLPLRKIAAAVAVVALMGVGSMVGVKHLATQQAVVAHDVMQNQNESGGDDATFNEMADYTMMDNETIYASLLAEN